MTFQAVGQAVGSYFGPWGSMIGSLIGSAIDMAVAEGPPEGDLSAPSIQLGRKLPRIYGRVRLPCNPIWASDYRATEHGGKGGEPPGPNSYSLDMLCAVADGSNVIAVTRIWVNKKLVYTSLVDSSEASIIYSQGGWSAIAQAVAAGPDAWSSFELLTGGPSQVPWSTYEDAVGAANAPAYRNICTIGFADLQCGGGKTPPAVEVEVITNGTQDDVGVPAAYTFPGRVFDYRVASSTDYDSYSSVNYQRFDGNWSIEIDGLDVISASAVTNNPVLEWRTFTTAGAQLDIVIFLYGTEGGLRVSVQNGSGFSGPDMAGNGPMNIRLAYTDTTNTLALYVNSSPYATTTAPELVNHWATGAARELIVGQDSGGGISDGAMFIAVEIRLINNSGEAEVWTPLPETLDDIIGAELLQNPEVLSSDFDVTDLSSIEVVGYTAAGSPSRTVQELCEVHYVDVVPANPNRFQRRGTASVSTIPFVDTGVGANDPSGPFSGLKRGNADERPAIAAIKFPLIDKDHEAGLERGDRLATDSDDVRTIETRVVMDAETAKGRAITATLLDRVRSHTAQFALSDKYAKAEPADVYTPEDNDGNSYRLRIDRFTYADGVKSINWELDDTTALVETGLTDTNYTPSVEIVPPGVAEVLPLDIPLQRVQDDGPGYLAAVKCSDESMVYFLESPSDTTYTEVAQFPLDAVFGTVNSITGTPSIVATDTGCSVAVDVGDGSLSAITDATLLLDTTANRFVMGAYGREVIGQFRDCTLSSPGVYVLSGFLWGLNGTAQYVDDLTFGDHFCLLNEAGGVKPIDRTSAQLGVEHYIKVVPERRSQAAVSGEAFTNSGVAVTPLVGINPHAERDSGTGDITITWDRQTRHPTRFGGDLGDSCPLGEESERYRVRLYTDNTFATLVREFDVVTTASVTYTSAQRTTDSHSPITAALYVDVRQISATVGEGYALQATL
jgi:hypothetical protein